MRERQKPVAGRAKAGNENFRQAPQTSLDANRTAGTWLSLWLRQAEMAQDWQNGFSRLARMTHGALAVTQRHTSEVVALMGHSTRAKLVLLEQALAAVGTPSVVGSQAKWLQVWTGALCLAQSNAAALAGINTRTLNSWAQLIQAHNGSTRL